MKYSVFRTCHIQIGVVVDPSKIQFMLDWPNPKDGEGSEVFLR